MSDDHENTFSTVSAPPPTSEELADFERRLRRLLKKAGDRDDDLAALRMHMEERLPEKSSDDDKAA